MAKVQTNELQPLSPGHFRITFAKLELSKPELVTSNGIQLKVTLGPHTLYSATSTTSEFTQDHFQFNVSYHAQLFWSLMIDVYIPRMLRNTHIGRAEIRIADLETMPPKAQFWAELWPHFESKSNISPLSARVILSPNIGALQCTIESSLEKHATLLKVVNQGSDADLSSAIGPTQPIITKTQIVGAANEPPAGSSSQAHKKVYTGGDQVRAFDLLYSSSAEERLSRSATLRDNNVNADKESARKRSIDDMSREPDASHGICVTSPPISEEQRNKESDRLNSDLPSFSQLNRYTQQGSSQITHLPEASNANLSASSGSIQNTDREHHDQKEQQSDNSVTSPPWWSKLLLSEETASVLQGVRTLLNTFNQGLEFSNATLITGIWYLKKFYDDLPIERTGSIVTDVQQIESARYFYKYAIAAYGWKGLQFFGKRNNMLRDTTRANADKHAIQEFLNLQDQQILKFSLHGTFGGGIFSPGYFVTHDVMTNSIIISIRGTMSLFDTLTDLVCEYSPWNHGVVHDGIYTASTVLFAELAGDLQHHVDKNKVARVFVTGHSLGGGTASLLAIMLEKVISVPVHAYVFAPPPILSLNLSIKAKGIVTSFITDADVVSRVCYGSVMDLKLMVIAAVEVGSGEIWAVKAGDKIEWKFRFTEEQMKPTKANWLMRKIRTRSKSPSESTRTASESEYESEEVSPARSQPSNIALEHPELTAAEKDVLESVLSKSEGMQRWLLRDGSQQRVPPTSTSPHPRKSGRQRRKRPKIVPSKTTNHEALLLARQYIHEERNANPKLYIAGQAYRLYNVDKTSTPMHTVMERANVESLSELRIGKNFLYDHMPSRYDTFFARAAEWAAFSGKSSTEAKYDNIPSVSSQP